MDVQIDDINTYDFRFEALNQEKNILLNSRDVNGNMDVVLFGRNVQVGERILLTLLGQESEEIESAWRVSTVSESHNHGRAAYHCFLTYEGLITP